MSTRFDIAFVVGMLAKYQSNPSMEDWKAAKRVIRCFQGTKDYKLTYKHSDHLEVIKHSNFNFTRCIDFRKSTLGYIFLLIGGVIS